MNYLSVESLSKTFGDRTILDNLSFGIQQGQKVALVGVNGSGKSTLLKILVGTESPDSGSVVYKNDIEVKALVQNPEFPKGATILECIFDPTDATHQLLINYTKESSKAEPNVDRLQTLIEDMDAHNAWNLEQEAKSILGKLGLNELEHEVQLLSGGQQKRIALAQVLIRKPDLLILDEPTNHLDIETIEWLENELSQSKMAIILVTHDRYFLEKVTNEIIELEQGQLHTYNGDYAYFLEKKGERAANEASVVDKAKNLYRKELDWIRRQPKARGTKAKYRVDAFEDTKQTAFSQSTEKNLTLTAQASRQGKKVLEIDKLSHGYGEKDLIKDFSYIFQRKDRIGIVGPNGAGKTTLLKLLQQEIAPTSGEIDKGETTKFGYYKQTELSFNPTQTVIDFAKDIAEVVEMGKGRTIPISQFLTRFLFPPEVQYKPIGKLSGGEKKRLQLLEVLIQSPNFLILDEPTNDLDLITLNTLEGYLENFDGCILIVSHDRYFMDKLVEHLFVFDGVGKISDFPGNYTQYRFEVDVKPKSQKESKEVQNVVPKEQKERKKLSYKEKLEFEQLEAEMPKLEAKKEALMNKLNTGSNDHEELSNWTKELGHISDELDEKELRWLELSEYA